MSSAIISKLPFNIILLLTAASATPLQSVNEGRIVGGWETEIANFPYQVSLQYLQTHVCGGSIIQEDLVLTAAHCVESFKDPKLYNIRAGSTKRAENGLVIAVKAIKYHEDYCQPSYGNNDIALLKLDKPLTYSHDIQPIPLMQPIEELKEMQTLFVSGWGTENIQTSQMSPVLRYTVVNKWPQLECQETYKTTTDITANMLCAAQSEGGRDSCQGDSGGPLVGIVNNTIKLVGIVSFGMECGNVNYPGVYTRVQQYHDWLDGTIKELNLS